MHHFISLCITCEAVSPAFKHLKNRNAPERTDLLLYALHTTHYTCVFRGRQSLSYWCMCGASLCNKVLVANVLSFLHIRFLIVPMLNVSIMQFTTLKILFFFKQKVSNRIIQCIRHSFITCAVLTAAWSYLWFLK